jgi:UDP-N-acetylglucosamine 2-epimerase (non-hydrolysing)
VLVTSHRKENLGESMESICRALRELSLRWADEMQVVFPVHLNPAVREPVHRHLDGLENVTLLEPVDYRSLAWLLGRCHFLVTDSGGLQEEAAGVHKPVLVLRDATERPEGVAAGMARLVGSRGDRLLDEASRLMSDPDEYARMVAATDPCPYGDGHAAARIVEILGAASLEPRPKAFAGL